ncbi:helix-turn-helix transcriptional regulator [Thermoanaerobacterium sp. DL9XJH110]|uniref:helix-turn-helix transcriptional regulator n=1 Tax=Thermoanaerobacterium sp. DL9XJH110 TaxID=3386643 RepID=UPI003BB61C2D
MNLHKLKELRKAKGLTQEQMAKLLGYKDKSGYCQLENGDIKMTLEKAIKISKILEADIKEIFFEVNVESCSTKIKQTA